MTPVSSAVLHRPVSGPSVTSMSTDDTTASEHGADAETTEVPPPPPGDEPGLAWSIDDDTEEIQPNRHGRLIWASLGILVLAITAALVLLLSTLFTRHQANIAKPQPIPTTPPPSTYVPPPPAPVAMPPTVTTPSVASASPYATLVGTWIGHERWLTVSADGTIEMAIPDFPACPSCSMASMPDATIHIGLTSYDAIPDGTPDGSGKFFGYVKESSDTRLVPVAVPVEADVINATNYGHPVPGRVLTISINSANSVATNEGNQLANQLPFCDKTSDQQGVCGA